MLYLSYNLTTSLCILFSLLSQNTINADLAFLTLLTFAICVTNTLDILYTMVFGQDFLGNDHLRYIYGSNCFIQVISSYMAATIMYISNTSGVIIQILLTITNLISFFMVFKHNVTVHDIYTDGISMLLIGLFILSML